MTAGIEVPVTLHLDHCPERAVITECLERGWNSVLFDASQLPVEENQRQTVEVVAEARRHGAHVEGEIESITGVEDGVGSDAEADAADRSTVVAGIPRPHRGRRVRPGHRQRARGRTRRLRSWTPSGSPTSWTPTGSRSRCTAAAG